MFNEFALTTLATLFINPNVTYTISFISGDSYETVLSYNGVVLDVTAAITATFTLSQDALDQADVNQASSIVTSYFVGGTVLVPNYNEGTKTNAFLAKANQLVDGLGVIISINAVTHQAGNNPSTFEIQILKGTQIVTITLDVIFSK